ncbi:hypothetical protein [Amycolatopsis sp. WGS_07]|uniref:hypothetical protein n=1 Tax=Amycolatopsis sp. WGS_07 TaxID=3076764 RepID=UPI0038731525
MTFGIVCGLEPFADRSGTWRGLWRDVRSSAATDGARACVGSGLARCARFAHDHAEGLGHDVGTDEAAEERAPGAHLGRGQHPERDLEQHEEQRDAYQQHPERRQRRPEQMDTAGKDRPDCGDQHHRLGDLDTERGSDRPPPPAGERVGVRQGMADEEQRPADDQAQSDDDSDGVHDQQRDADHDEHQADEDREQPASRSAVERLGHRVAHQGRADPAAQHALGQAVGQPDDFVNEEQRQRRGDERERDPRRDLFERVAGLEALVAHHENGTGEDEQAVRGDDDLPRTVPQFADTWQVADGGRRQCAMPDQVQDRRQGGVDDAAERRVDRLGDTCADVGDAALRVAVAAAFARRVRTGRGRGCRRLRDAVLACARCSCRRTQ